MSDDRSKMLSVTIQKLHARGARSNIKNILDKTHAADVAEMLDRLPPEDRYQIFLMIREEDKAEVLSHLEEEEQTELIALLSRDDVLKIVSDMDSDDAADLLGNIPEDEADEILSSMEKEESQEVAGLMGYPEDSAGGIMSSDYFALPQWMSVAQVISRIQEEGDQGKVLFYVYVVNDSNQLVGVSSLKQLLLSKKDDILSEIMFTDVISVDVTTHQEDVAKTVEKYDFLSLPVVSNGNELAGVITVDDVIDVIREEAEEDLLAMGQAGWGLNMSTWEHFLARIPWLLFAYLGGGACFIIVYVFKSSDSADVTSLWLAAAFVPLLLAMGATTGSQAATMAVGNIRSGGFDLSKAIKQWQKELKLSLGFAVIFAVATWLLAWVFPSVGDFGLLFSIAISIQIIVAMTIGSGIPVLLNRLGVDPTVASVPLFTAFADVTAVAVLFGLMHNW